MKFSLGKKNEIEQSLDITIPANEIETEVTSKLHEVQKSAKIKGFRKGKAPIDVIRKIYEPEIRIDVINDVVAKKFYDQVEKKGFKPVGNPDLSPVNLEKNKDIKFSAKFETYPEIRIAKLNKLTYTKTISTVSEEDITLAIEKIQKRMCSWEPNKEKSKDGNQVKINFVGTMEGKEFEGGSAKEFIVEIGSRSMIEGFEEGLLGVQMDDKKKLDLKFPDDYGKSELASKDVTFEVEIKEVLKPVLPNLNGDFFKSTGFDVKNIDEYRKEVKKKLEEDLENLLKDKSKKSILDSLREAHSFSVPQAMLASEIDRMRTDTATKMGMDPKEIKDEMFPKDSFREEALKRVTIGIILNKLIEERGLKADSERVRQIIEERAAIYKEPSQVVNWFYSNEEQLKNIESVSLEEQVIDILLSEAKSIEEEISYEECISKTNLT